MSFKKLLAMAAVTLPLSFAHDLFIMPEQFRLAAGATVNFSIHHGDLFPESEQVPPMVRLKDTFVFSAKGKEPIAAPKADGKRAVGSVTLGKGHQILTAVLGENVVPMDAKEFTEYLEKDGLTEAIEYRKKNGQTDQGGRELYSKYAKTIVVAGEGDGGFSRVVGFPIEIVPDADPTQAKKGDELPVHVLVHGKPTAGILVLASTVGQEPKTIGRTDANGSIRVPITAPGKWRLHAKSMRKASVPTADWESFWATLVWETR